MKKALILVDIQNDYFNEGNLPLYESEKAAENAALLLDFFRKNNSDIIFIQHVNPKERGFFVEGTNGVEIHSSVKPLQKEIIIQKRFPNSFKETGLLETLKELKVKQLLICGMMSHMCIDATARAARDFDFDVTLIEDACTTKNMSYKNKTVLAEDVHTAFIAALEEGAYAKILSTKQFLEG